MNSKKTYINPPRIAEWLLKFFFPDNGGNSQAGDFEEMYLEIISQKGRLTAYLWYWAQLFVSLKPLFTDSIYWSYTMFRNYLKITFRNIVKQKGFSFINISGLSIGIASCLLILMWVGNELSYDQYHENAENIYLVAARQHYSDNIITEQHTPGPLAPALKERFPEVIEAARMGYAASRVVRRGEHIFYEDNIWAADQALFDIFSFEFIKGDKNTALSDPSSVVITAEIAEKYFGSEDPVGKQIRIDNRFDFTVTGVIKNIPGNSVLQFDFVAHFDLMEKLGWWVDNWQYSFFTTYIRLKPETREDEFNQKFADTIKQHHENSVNELYLKPFTSLHLYSEFEGYGTANMIKYVYIFSAIAIFILAIACINFMNLSTARSANRALEIGMRKVVGARRKQLIWQFYGESFTISFISMIAAVCIVVFLLPEFNEITGKTLSFGNTGVRTIIFSLLGVTLISGILAGSYPALFLSSFKPVSVLKGNIRTGSKNSVFRKILVTTQFTLSIILIIGTIVIYNQIDYIKNKNLGFDKEHLINIEMSLSADNANIYNAFKNELRQFPKILDVSGGWLPPTWIASESEEVNWEGKNQDETIMVNLSSIDYDYIETFGIEMADGRSFSREYATDSVSAVLINEEMAELMGNEKALDNPLWIGKFKGNIIGVMKNFHFKPLQSTSIRPLVFFLSSRGINFIFVKIQPENISSTIADIKNSWETVNPDFPFRYEFVDSQFDALYESEEQTATLLKYFTFLAIFIASLGLFGLASFTIEQRTKEIGIRKVLGASIANVIMLLCRDFLLLVFVASIAAWPVAYLVMNRWLQDFAARTSISYLAFILASLIALIAALFTVGIQALKAARTNPAKALKYE